MNIKNTALALIACLSLASCSEDTPNVVSKDGEKIKLRLEYGRDKYYDRTLYISKVTIYEKAYLYIENDQGSAPTIIEDPTVVRDSTVVEREAQPKIALPEVP